MTTPRALRHYHLPLGIFLPPRKVTPLSQFAVTCRFSASTGSLPAHMERMRSHPDIAGKVMRLEYTAMSLNPNAKLCGRKSLLEMFDPTQPRDRACLEAFERELDMPWALYLLVPA